MLRPRFVFVLLAPLTTACLSETRRGLTDTDTSADTAQDADTQAPTDTRDTHNPCLDVDCDDQDECTYDYCDPATGLCQNLALPSASQADQAAPAPCPGGCDDSDSCTVDTCVYVPEGCGAAGYYTCVHVPSDTPECLPCAGCDDGDPCTIDTCGAQGCVHTAIEGCLAGCTVSDTLSIEAVIAQGPTDHVKTVGALFAPRLYQMCDDGPDCDCIGFPGLYDQGGHLLLAQTMGFAQDAWTCRTTGCGDTYSTCSPVQLGVRYRAWGRAIQDVQLGDRQAIAPVRVRALSVADFCLETVASSLVGEYEGVWQLNGDTSTFKATIKNDTAPRLEVTSATCPAGFTCPQGALSLSLPLQIGDGYVDVVTTNAPYPLGGLALRLYSNRNTLTGRYGTQSQGFALPEAPADPINPVGGTFTLTRLAPTATSYQP